MENSDQALNVLERDIAERLAPVCGNMSPESFRELVRDIALVKVKYGVQSLAADERYSEIGEAVVIARVERQVDQPPEASA